VEVDFISEVRRSVLVSYQIRSWKWVKKSIARESKFPQEFHDNSIYHFVVKPVRVLWKILKRMELSIKELEEHQRWKVMTWFLGYSPGFPSNFETLDDSLEGIRGQNGACCMGSFVKCEKSSISKVAKK